MPLSNQHRLKAIRKIASHTAADKADERLAMIADIASGKKQPSDFRDTPDIQSILKRLEDGRASRSPRTALVPQRGEPGGFDRMDTGGETRTQKKTTPKKKEEPKSDGTSA